ncbi:MAG: 30S ribosomal protein S2 [bacterium]
MIDVPMKSLLETGVHFGHQPRRWNPKMEPYIFTERKGVHIIDLEQTIERVKQVTEMVTQRVADGETVLFVGTKRQAQESLEEEARRCGMPYVCNRWLGGTLTNFKTIRKSVDKLNELERMEEENIMDRLSNKEARSLQREKNRLLRNLEGIRDMESLPDMIYVTDLIREDIAVKEANKLNIPLVGILDTNVDPDRVDYGIPGNDDAIRALALYSEIMADAVVEGKKIREERIAEEQAQLQAEQVEEEDIPAEAEIIESAEEEEPEAVAETVEVDEESTEEPPEQIAEVESEETSEEEVQQASEESEETSEEDVENVEGEVAEADVVETP